MVKKTSTQLIRTLLFFGTIVSFYFVPWPIVRAWMMPIPSTLQQQVDQAADYGFDGIIVYIDKKASHPKLYASGYKNSKSKTPADPNALFKIASVGKLYQALAVAKLVGAGKLSLDKTLADYLPEFKNRIEYADQISLKMMVQHKSGIPNYTDTYMYWTAPKETADENLALILDLPANFKPDKAYEYSNTNYLLLDRIMNSVLGYPTFQFVQEEILMPLDLNHTYGSIRDVNIEDVMSGYYVGYDADLRTNDVGSMLATAEDLGKFVRALNEGSVFKDQKEQEIYSLIYTYEHTGLIPGYQTIAKYHKNIDAVVIQFTNTVNFEGYNWSLSKIMYDRIVKILERAN